MVDDLSFDTAEFDRKHAIRRERKTTWLREKYRDERERLIVDMGAVCEKCGVTEGLEVDHKNGRDWELSKTIDRLRRLRRYRAEWENGRHVRLLCKTCNVTRSNEARKNVPTD